MMKRITALLLCAVLALTAFSAVAETYRMAGFDGQDSEHDWTTNKFFTRMEARTGLSFTFDQYTDASKWQAAKDAMFAEDGQLPDVLFKAALTTEELLRYTESGQIIDLAPLLEENAPNLWALLQEHLDWLSAITLPNGKIGALPTLQTLAPQDPIWINKDWLDKLKLEMPTDMDSLREVLIAFRDRDPNGNGKKDEIPMTFLGPWELKLFSHAYGVAVNDYNIYLDEEGQVHYWPLEDSFIQLATTLHSFYQEGLLDPNGFQTTDSLRRLTDDDSAVTYGAFFAPTPLNVLTTTMAKSYVVLDPLTYEGDQVYRDLVGQVTRGAFAITSACEDPAALLRWVDVLYTEEGAAEAMLGIAGEDYVISEAGRWNWKGGTENMSLTTFNELSIYDTGSMPWLFPQDFYEKYTDTEVIRLNDELKRFSQFVQKPFPDVSLTGEQRQEALRLQSQLGEYVDVALARFVLGELSLDEEGIAAFRAELKSRGAEEMTAFWQNIADNLN